MLRISILSPNSDKMGDFQPQILCVWEIIWARVKFFGQASCDDAINPGKRSGNA